MPHQYDVVIIGAGFAGITAARELTQRGKKVVVVEARNRLGGRTWTDYRLGKDLEIGGTWIHWTQPHVWAEVTRYGKEVVRGPRAEETYWYAGNEVRKGSLEELMKLIDSGQTKLVAKAMELIPRPDQYNPTEALKEADQLTLQDVMDSLDLSEDERNANEVAWIGHFNGPLNECSYVSALRWASAEAGIWRLMHEATAVFRLAEGTKGLIQSMADDAGVDIRFNSPVVRVKNEENGVKVVLKGGEEIAAAKGVITLSQNTIGQLPVEPALSAGKREASRQRTGSQGVKAWIKVKGPIKPFFAYSTQKHPLSVIRTEYIGDDYAILVGFGADKRRIDVNNIDEIQKALRAWRDDLEIIECTGHNWMDDEYAQETWVIQRPGQFTSYHEELKRPEGNLYFASGDHANIWAGFIDGAIESGLRVTREILADG